MITQKLDDRVEAELRNRIIVPNVDVSFYRRNIPGRGYFEISSSINGANFEYSREPQKIVLTLMKDSDIINVHSNGKIVYEVWVMTSAMKILILYAELKETHGKV